MSKKPQTATELSKTLAGQISKSEKRVKLARDIREYRAQAHKAIKAFKLRQMQLG